MTGAMAVTPTHDPDALWDLEILAGARGLGDWMFEQFAPYVGDTVAEVGAGIGTYTDRLLAAAARHVLALDPEPPCLARLHQRYDADARVTVSGDLLPGSPDMR